jgi:hypothetical protein
MLAHPFAWRKVWGYQNLKLYNEEEQTIPL